MTMLQKVAAVFTAFGAVNWVVLSMWEKDALTQTLGPERTIGTDSLKIIVALCALLLLVGIFQRRNG